MDWFNDPNAWLGLLTLTALEVVLGVGVYALSTLLTLRDEKRSPTQEERQSLARFVGLGAKQFNNGQDGVFVGRWGSKEDTPNDRIAGLMKRFRPQ